MNKLKNIVGFFGEITRQQPNFDVADRVTKPLQLPERTAVPFGKKASELNVVAMLTEKFPCSAKLVKRDGERGITQIISS